jgi:hypothetical protein
MSLHHRVLLSQERLTHLQRRWAQGWFAARAVLWLWMLPIRLRWFSFPVLLQQLSRQPLSVRRSRSLDLSDLVSVVVRLCRLRIFQGRFFPRVCLRQSLALYALLSRAGYPVMIHVGVHKDSEIVHGHSWVTLHGQPLTERAPETHFTLLYTYPCITKTSTPIPDDNKSSIQIGGKYGQRTNATT